MIVAEPRLRILGSGSTGNGAILDLHDAEGRTRHLLIDLGLGPRTLQRRADACGHAFDPEAVVGVVVTHADQDHLRPTWSRTLRDRGWPVHALPSHHPAMARAGVPAGSLRPLPDGGRVAPLASDHGLGVAITAAIAPHDDHGTAAVRLSIETGQRSTTLGWATDLGRATPAVIGLLDGCDTIAIESNYDPELQAVSDRPPYLKNRITGGHGHLSNRECLDAIVATTTGRLPNAVVLLHLSRDCNHPELVHRLWRGRAPHLHAAVRIAHHAHPLDPIALRASTSIETDRPLEAAAPPASPTPSLFG